MLMMSIHSNGKKHYKVAKYGERIDFLPPKKSTPPLVLLAKHFVPLECLKHLGEDAKYAEIDFALDSLISECKKKIWDMVDITDRKSVNICSHINDFTHVQPYHFQSASRLQLETSI